jgi:hypothetical protein
MSLGGRRPAARSRPDPGRTPYGCVVPYKTLFEDGNDSGVVGFREIKVLTQGCHEDVSVTAFSYSSSHATISFRLKITHDLAVLGYS